LYAIADDIASGRLRRRHRLNLLASRLSRDFSAIVNVSISDLPEFSMSNLVLQLHAFVSLGSDGNVTATMVSRPDLHGRLGD